MKYVTIALVGLIALGSSGYVYWTSTPEFAFYKIKESVEQKNKALFESHVDVKKITGSVVDEVVQTTISQTSQKKNGWAAIGGIFAAKMMESMKPQLEGIVEKELNKLFESERTVASKAKENNQFKDLANVRAQLTFVGYEKKDCSDYICYFNLNVQHDITKQQATFKAKMEKINGSWKLVELPSFIEQLKKLKT